MTALSRAMGQARPGRSARMIARRRNHQITRPSSSAPSSQGSQALKLYEGNSHGRAMPMLLTSTPPGRVIGLLDSGGITDSTAVRSEEHTSELQSRGQLVCRLLL